MALVRIVNFRYPWKIGKLMAQLRRVVEVREFSTFQSIVQNPILISWTHEHAQAEYTYA